MRVSRIRQAKVDRAWPWAPVITLVLWFTLAAPNLAQTLPEGFQFEPVLEDLNSPTVVQFAPDGRVFVAEKAGIVKVFADLEDTAPDVLVDLREAVHDFWDRGLMGLAVDPQFPVRPYIYLLYTYNYDPAEPEAGVPRWPDSCPNPPGATQDGCVANGRLSRIEVAADNSMIGVEHVLVENRWCTQFPSHTVGTVAFDVHGALLAGAGDGANINTADYGQNGGSSESPTPANPCGDPPGGRGVALQPPSAEGGALRSQDIRSAGDPVGYDGAIIRVDPDTGDALPTNPLFGGDPEDDRVIAYGLRNPFRFAVRPDEGDVWVGDVGWSTWEEINRIADVQDDIVENFGWPCYEGPDRQAAFDNLDLTLCENLYADTVDPATPPFFTYEHGVNVDPNPEPFRCTREGSSSVAGLTFMEGSAYPENYNDAMFFSDFSRACIFVMFPDEHGLPDPDSRTTFAESLPAVQLVTGPDGLLYYPDIFGGTISRINYFDTNVDPQAIANASVDSGTLPLEVQFDASQSFDPDSDGALTYAWDLDGDGAFDDSTLANPLYTYRSQMQTAVGLRVTDEDGASDTDELVITAGNRRPVVTINQPDAELAWRVGDAIAFQAQAFDPDEGALAADTMTWTVTLNHCPGGPDDCHTHPVAEFAGVAQGSFSAPDHEWYSFLEIELTVRDNGFPGGVGGVGTLSTSKTVALDPETVALTFESDPPGMELVFGGLSGTTPFTQNAIARSTHSISAPSPQGGRVFHYWSDLGTQAHEIVAPDTAATFRATFANICEGPNCLPILRVAAPPTTFAPYPSIQAAVDVVRSTGSVIEVLPSAVAYDGITVANLKGITIRGIDDGTGTPVIVDGGEGAAVEMVLQSALHRLSVTLENLTLTGSIGVQTETPSVLRNIAFRDIDDAAIVLNGKTHRHDRLDMDASVTNGIRVGTGADLRLDRSVLRGIGGLAVDVDGWVDIANTVIDGAADGIRIGSGGNLELRHSTLLNTPGTAVDNSAGGSARVAYSVVWGSGGMGLAGLACDDVLQSNVDAPDCTMTGNLSSDPLLLADYTPAPGSPLVDFGPLVNTVASAPCVDLLGNTRFRDNDGDGLANTDPGAVERTVSAAPDEVTGLSWSDTSTLSWDPNPEAVSYHVYRGEFAELGLPSLGACRNDLDPDPTDTTLNDAEAPLSGAGFIYLITARDEAGAASSTGLSGCAERSVSPICPP